MQNMIPKEKSETDHVKDIGQIPLIVAELNNVILNLAAELLD